MTQFGINAIKSLLISKKGRKLLKSICIVIIIIAFMIGGAVVGMGLAPVSILGKTIEGIWEYINPEGQDKNTWSANVSADQLLKAFESGYKLPEGIEAKMRLAPGNFEYMLKKITDKEAEAQVTKTISVQGLHEYTVEVENTYTDAEGKTHTDTTEESREEFIYREATVTNAPLEELHKVDWRLLYTYSLLATIDRRGVTPENAEGRSWLIQKSDIDNAFSQISMTYSYAFDVLRNFNTTYDFETCKSLPHVESIIGDPDTRSGRYTYYYPRSLLNYGLSGYSTMAHTVSGDSITGVEELFDNAKFEIFGKSLCKYYNYKYLKTLLSRMPGGTAIVDKTDWYIKQAESGNSVMGNQVYLIDPGDFEISSDGRYIYDGVLPPVPGGGNGDVGSAAVQLARSRLDWKYSQAYRYRVGYWDCSSMVERVYRELGVELPSGLNTDSLLRLAYSYNQVIIESNLEPGDILFFKTKDGENKNHLEGVGHVVMYAGNGMIVHAASTKLGTVYQPLASYSGYKSRLIVCARPYQNIKNNYVPPERPIGNTLASELKNISESEFAARALEMAREDYSVSGILPSVTAAQLILESGYCSSKLSLEANNCFGMKTELSGNTWGNSTWDKVSLVKMPTKEQDNLGNEYTIIALFRKYRSVEESIGDHSAYLLGATKGSKLRYEGLTNAANYEAAAQIIKNGGYATDINYVAKLSKIIKRFDLDKYDNKPADNSNGSLTGEGNIVVIDAGHQSKGNNDLEPLAPGSTKLKAKVSTGTQGVSTGIAEYVVNLQVALKLKAELIRRGYKVYMIRETHNVNISNAERAEMAEENGAEILVRIHCNSVLDPTVKGTLTMCQTKKNPWVGAQHTESRRLSDAIVGAISAATGLKNKGILETDEMTGINWCAMPVTIVEMGFMSNVEEDKKLCNDAFQDKMATGIANGIDKYFKQ